MLQGVPRDFVSLLAEFVSCLMIRFAVGYGCRGMGVRGQIVKFSGLIVQTLRHCVLLASSMQSVRQGPAFISPIQTGARWPEPGFQGLGKHASRRIF
jgi:hypothetical protein